LNRLQGVLQRHSRSLNRKCATAIAFQATSDDIPATRLPLPETPNLAQYPVRRGPIKAKAARQRDGDYLDSSQRTSAWSIPRTRS
jgi:hypothetical protein